MAIRITHIRFGGSARTEGEIVRYRWISDETGKVGENDKLALADWIRVRGGEAYVGTGDTRASIGVVESRAGGPFLRTHADGTWTNDLLCLDTF